MRAALGGEGAAETRAGEALLRNWRRPRPGGRRGGFPGAQARGGPPRWALFPKPQPRGPWSLGCRPQPGPLPRPHSCPSRYPASRTPEGLCYHTAGWEEGEGEGQLGLILLFTWVHGGGSDGAGSGGAVGCTGLKPMGEVGRKGEKGRQGLRGAHFTGKPRTPCPGAPELRRGPRSRRRR